MNEAVQHTFSFLRFTMTMMLRSLIVVVACVVVAVHGQQANLDQFTYGDTDTSLNNVYGPEQWGRVRCANLDDCLGWPDSWETGIEWELTENHW